MSKLNIKKQYYNEEALKTLQIKYGYSIDYIRKSIRGDRTGTMPDEIKTEYKKLVKAAKEAIADASKTN